MSPNPFNPLKPLFTPLEEARRAADPAPFGLRRIGLDPTALSATDALREALPQSDLPRLAPPLSLQDLMADLLSPAQRHLRDVAKATFTADLFARPTAAPSDPADRWRTLSANLTPSDLIPSDLLRTIGDIASAVRDHAGRSRIRGNDALSAARNADAAAAAMAAANDTLSPLTLPASLADLFQLSPSSLTPAAGAATPWHDALSKSLLRNPDHIRSLLDEAAASTAAAIPASLADTLRRLLPPDTALANTYLPTAPPAIWSDPFGARLQEAVAGIIASRALGLDTDTVLIDTPLRPLAEVLADATSLDLNDLPQVLAWQGAFYTQMFDALRAVILSALARAQRLTPRDVIDLVWQLLIIVATIEGALQYGTRVFGIPSASSTPPSIERPAIQQPAPAPATPSSRDTFLSVVPSIVAEVLATVPPRCRVTKHETIVRASPHRHGRVLGRLPPGACVVATDKAGAWIAIRFVPPASETPTTGWLYTRNLTAFDQ